MNETRNGNNNYESVINDAAEKLSARNLKLGFANSVGLKAQTESLIGFLRSAMYPGIFGNGCDGGYQSQAIQISLRRAEMLMREILVSILPLCGKSADEAAGITAEFISGLDSICEYLETDITAAYEGDPAAISEEEIILAYPAFEAISIYRIAHRLYELGVRILPRMMTEYAHRTTGIDIHPGATIGKYFFIDHGTGVVIGETCTIKEHVKLYQGVTLGARSFKTDANGNPVKGIKRHPDIGNNVIIYAGATILGGNTYVGDNSVIGSNVWLTSSVPAGSRVYYTPNATDIKIQ